MVTRAVPPPTWLGRGVSSGNPGALGKAGRGTGQPKPHGGPLQPTSLKDEGMKLKDCTLSEWGTAFGKHFLLPSCVSPISPTFLSSSPKGMSAPEDKVGLPRSCGA